MYELGRKDASENLMDACFKYIAPTPETDKITLQQFIEGIPKLYACSFHPAGFVEKKKKSKKDGKKSSSKDKSAAKKKSELLKAQISKLGGDESVVDQKSLSMGSNKKADEPSQSNAAIERLMMSADKQKNRLSALNSEAQSTPSDSAKASNESLEG